jgi:TetR/AcrR family transcriptional repressor of nem operon
MAAKTNSKIRLIETAIDLVRMSSYSDVGVNEICNKAGVTKGAFYHHFKSKAALYAEAAAYKKSNEELVLNALLADKHAPLKKLNNMIGYVYYKGFQDTETKNKRVSGCPFFTAGAINSSNDDLICEASKDYVEGEVGYWRRVITDLADSNLIDRPEDITQLARMVYQYANGVLTYSRIFDDEQMMKADLEAGIYRFLHINMAA